MFLMRIRPTPLVLPFSHPDTLTTRLQRFCEQYWGRGDEGRREIYKEHHLSVPYMSDGDDEVDNTQEFEGDSNADEMDNVELGHDVAGGSDGDPSAGEMDLADDGLGDAGRSQVSYKTLSLGAGFESFFSARNEILVRDEYPAMLDHIKRVETQNGRRGVVVIGQPGIGMDLPQCLTSSLDSDNRKNTVSILRTR